MPKAAMQDRILIADIPYLKQLRWNRTDTTNIDAAADAPVLCERDWCHVDRASPEDCKAALVHRLVPEYGDRAFLTA